MDVIYRGARGMVILLENVQITAEEKRILNRWHEQVHPTVRKDWRRVLADRDDQSPSLEANERVLMAGVFLKILSARWFQRAWCSRELKVSPYPLRLQPADIQLMHLYGPEKEIIKVNILFLNDMFGEFYKDTHSAEVEPVANVKKQRELADMYARVLIPRYFKRTTV